MIKNLRGDLFLLAPKESVLVHATNCAGVWGSGIAKTFKEKCPGAYRAYHTICFDSKNILGKAYILLDDNYKVGCLMTSEGYGNNIDSQANILKNTKSSLINFLEQLKFYGFPPVYSNKFNSGLFAVPWEQSEQILINLLKQEEYKDVNWTIVEYIK